MHDIPYEPRIYIARPWRPLTRDEFEEVARFLPGLRDDLPKRGRPHDNPRRTLDAIFWIACSKGPWRALPPELGRADTAHRTLRRWALKGHLDALLFALSSHYLANGTKLLRSMGYWICRAWRRMCRVVSTHAVWVVQGMKLLTAWPAEVLRLPHRYFEAFRMMRQMLVEMLWWGGGRLLRLAGRPGLPAAAVPAAGLAAGARAALKAARRLVHAASGNRRAWRTC